MMRQTICPAGLRRCLWICRGDVDGSDAKGAWRIWRRGPAQPRQPEQRADGKRLRRGAGGSAGQPATYFGEYYDKPTIGDPLRTIEPKDILRANRMMRVASVLGLIAATGIRLMIGV